MTRIVIYVHYCVLDFLPWRALRAAIVPAKIATPRRPSSPRRTQRGRLGDVPDITPEEYERRGVPPTLCSASSCARLPATSDDRSNGPEAPLAQLRRPSAADRSRSAARGLPADGISKCRQVHGGQHKAVYPAASLSNVAATGSHTTGGCSHPQYPQAIHVNASPSTLCLPQSGDRQEQFWQPHRCSGDTKGGPKISANAGPWIELTPCVSS